MRSLAPRERRLVAVGLLVGVLAGGWLLLVAPVIGGFQARAQARTDLIARYQAGQRLLASLPGVRTEAAVQRRSAALYQITAPSEALAADALGGRLSAALTDAGGAVGAVQPVQVDVPPGWVAVRADAVIPLTALVASLRRLENEPPYVVVDYASIGADRALRSGHSAPLEVRLQVSAAVHPAPGR